MSEHKLSFKDAKKYVFSSKSKKSATFTLENPISGHRHTYKVSYKAANGGWGAKYFVRAMTGSDNDRSYTYLGYVQDNDFQIMRKGPKGQNSDRSTFTGKSVIYFNWMLHTLFGSGTGFDSCNFYHHGNCGRCGKTLTVPSSIISGLGPVCSGLAA